MISQSFHAFFVGNARKVCDTVTLFWFISCFGEYYSKHDKEGDDLFHAILKYQLWIRYR